MSGVEDTGTPGTQQDEKKPLDGAGGGHINLKVKGQVTASLLSSPLLSSPLVSSRLGSFSLCKVSRN
jgi:hypothetical protein